MAFSPGGPGGLEEEGEDRHCLPSPTHPTPYCMPPFPTQIIPPYHTDHPTPSYARSARSYPIPLPASRPDQTDSRTGSLHKIAHHTFRHLAFLFPTSSSPTPTPPPPTNVTWWSPTAGWRRPHDLPPTWFGWFIPLPLLLPPLPHSSPAPQPTRTGWASGSSGFSD